MRMTWRLTMERFVMVDCALRFGARRMHKKYSVLVSTIKLLVEIVSLILKVATMHLDNIEIMLLRHISLLRLAL